MSQKRDMKYQLKIVLNLIVLILYLLIPIFASGDWFWLNGWVYFFTNLVFFVISRSIAIRVNPDIIRERVTASSKKDTKGWDKWLMPAMVVFPALISLVAGLNHRFGWQPSVQPELAILGLIIYVLVESFATWAMVVNTFFSSQVRIQTDRGHQVISDGPYKYIRHPGYLSGLLAMFSGALMLGSFWALVPALIGTPFFFLRTSLEDKTLQTELPGYEEYAQRVHYRLFPGIW